MFTPPCTVKSFKHLVKIDYKSKIQAKKIKAWKGNLVIGVSFVLDEKRMNKCLINIILAYPPKILFLPKISTIVST